MISSKVFRNIIPIIQFQFVRHQKTCQEPRSPVHLICFKDWTSEMVLNIVRSARNLKNMVPDTHGSQMCTLAGAKVMILQEVNRPVLQMAVSKAATMLGASDVTIVDEVNWDEDYNGRVFSSMADVIFVSTSTHMCIQRFSSYATVPVLCLLSRTHASLRALATIMTILEDFESMAGLNIAYFGTPHPVLNSYLLLAPMLGANIKYRCSCEATPVTPLLHKTGEELAKVNKTQFMVCKEKVEIFEGTNILISGPTPVKDKIEEFRIDFELIRRGTATKQWRFIHTCPRGPEVEDQLFHHKNARTFNVFANMQFVAAALMANAIKGVMF